MVVTVVGHFPANQRRKVVAMALVVELSSEEQLAVKVQLEATSGSVVDGYQTFWQSLVDYRDIVCLVCMLQVLVT